MAVMGAMKQELNQLSERVNKGVINVVAVQQNFRIYLLGS
jgi:hypothetical protein